MTKRVSIVVFLLFLFFISGGVYYFSLVAIKIHRMDFKDDMAYSKPTHKVFLQVEKENEIPSDLLLYGKYYDVLRYERKADGFILYLLEDKNETELDSFFKSIQSNQEPFNTLHAKILLKMLSLQFISLNTGKGFWDGQLHSNKIYFAMDDWCACDGHYRIVLMPPEAV